MKTLPTVTPLLTVNSSTFYYLQYIVNSLNLGAYRKCHMSKVLLGYWNKPKVGIKLCKFSILNTALEDNSFLFSEYLFP